MLLNQDGQYDKDAPGTPPPPYRPWETYEERLVDLALWGTYSAPAELLRTSKVQMRPRFEGGLRDQLTIQDVLASTRRQPIPMRMDFSGTNGGYDGGASTPSLGDAGGNS